MKPSKKDFFASREEMVAFLGEETIGYLGLSVDDEPYVVPFNFAHIDGWEHAGMAPNLTLELVRRGYSEEDIGKIWSGNFLRVWREVEWIASDR